MRLLHVVDTTLLRGGGIFASDLTRALIGEDVSQRVALLSDPGEPRVEYEAPQQVLAGNGRGLPRLRIRPKVLSALRALMRDWRPDVVQAHGGDTLKYTVPASMGRSGKIVYRQIGLPPPSQVGLKRAVNSQLLRHTNRVVAVAEAVRLETIRRLHVPPHRVVTIPNAVDSRRLQPVAGREATRRALGIPASAPVSLSLGALSWEKDPWTQLEVAGRVLDRVPKAFHLLVGEGPMRSDVEAAVRQNTRFSRVLVLGARRDVADLLSASDVLLFASRPDGMEGMPGNVIEAGIAGRPVVAFSVAGVPEVIVEGVTGCLVPHGDASGLARRMFDLLTNAEKRHEMGEAARDHCLSRFEIRTIAPTYLELYEQLLKS